MSGYLGGKTFEDWVSVRNIHKEKAFANLAKKISHANKSLFTVFRK